MKKNVMQIVQLAGVVTAIIISVIALNGNKKIAYYDYNKVYNECELKTSLERDLEKVVSMRASELDSLQLELSILSSRVKTGSGTQDELVQFEDLKNRYLTLQGKYEEENIRLKETYFAQIRKTINEKSIAYAKAHGFDYLMSAIGDGSLMYGSDDEDVTEEFLSYVNE